ncbi:MAG TPA: 1,6-anhydro-N-acetylmuramyl-L-alanine amidase AmpD [Gammaproteobacteria bacterium]|nr:1,6-anhydro-N-acetylmuramyl-L-alanine amidase AmpD [Gammaproteobacteria bacterium]
MSPPVDPATGLLAGVRYLQSPNCDDRPPGVAIDLLVIHGISLPPGKYGGPYIDQLFTNQLSSDEHPYFTTLAGLRVSAHVLIRREGDMTQYVPFHRRAWHAGASVFRGREGCNDYSIGIELEGTDTDAYTDAQYARLAGVCRILMRQWPAIGEDRIVGHSDVAPGRKTDPGTGFDWRRFRELLLQVT